MVLHDEKNKASAARSFKSLAADPDVPGVKKNDLYRIDPRLMDEEEGFNLRDYDDPEVIAHIEAFAYSYMSGIYVPPLVVRTTSDGRIVPVEGHCRRRGALLAIERGTDIKFLDCVPFRGNDAERVQVMLKSDDGLKYKPLKVAEGYLRLHRMGHSNAQIAQNQNKTPARVEQMLLLATAETDVHELVRSGAVTADVAIEAVRKYREEAGAFLRGEYKKAQAQGKERVTRGTVRGPSLPPKVMSSVVGSLRGVVESLDKRTRQHLAELESKDPSELEGQRVEIDAAVLLGLLHAQSEIDQVEAKHAARAQAAQAAAAQQQLPVDEQP